MSTRLQLKQGDNMDPVASAIASKQEIESATNFDHKERATKRCRNNANHDSTDPTPKRGKGIFSEIPALTRRGIYHVWGADIITTTEYRGLNAFHENILNGVDETAPYIGILTFAVSYERPFNEVTFTGSHIAPMPALNIVKTFMRSMYADGWSTWAHQYFLHNHAINTCIFLGAKQNSGIWAGKQDFLCLAFAIQDKSRWCKMDLLHVLDAFATIVICRIENLKLKHWSSPITYEYHCLIGSYRICAGDKVFISGAVADHHVCTHNRPYPTYVDPYINWGFKPKGRPKKVAERESPQGDIKKEAICWDQLIGGTKQRLSLANAESIDNL